MVNKKTKIFLCYANDDLEKVKEFYNKLGEAGLNPWLDNEKLLPGEVWEEAIYKEIKESDFFLVFLSNNAVTKAGFRHREITRALEVLDEQPEGKIYLIPARLEPCKVPERLKHIHCVDLFKNEDKAMEKILSVINEAPRFLGRIDRASNIITLIEDFTKESKKHKKEVVIRMSATFTSMSNIKHYNKKKIPGLLPGQEKTLDNLLVKERNCIKRLIDMDYVKLKCICWPRLRFLAKKYYSKEQKRGRIKRMFSFLNNSLEKHVVRREVLCDEFGAYGNKLIIGNKLAIIANPESGGYTETSIFKDLKDQQIIDVLIEGYDNIFNRLLKTREEFCQLEKGEKLNETMLRDAIRMFDLEVQASGL